MIWKAIGKSVMGTSHITSGKACEDACQYKVIDTDDGEILVCCVSDGAGSAIYAAEASAFSTQFLLNGITEKIYSGGNISEAGVYALMEELFDRLNEKALADNCDIDEYACTIIGCCIKDDESLFFQVGDGAIVIRMEGGVYQYVWWPENGEYQNVTSFIVSDKQFMDMRIDTKLGQVMEIAMFTDGLQLLALNNEFKEVHQPFFNALFPLLRMADTKEKITILNNKLEAYLNSDAINARTDDDKTLFLATRLVTA